MARKKAQFKEAITGIFPYLDDYQEDRKHNWITFRVRDSILYGQLTQLIKILGTQSISVTGWGWSQCCDSDEGIDVCVNDVVFREDQRQ